MNKYKIGDIVWSIKSDKNNNLILNKLVIFRIEFIGNHSGLVSRAIPSELIRYKATVLDADSDMKTVLFETCTQDKLFKTKEEAIAHYQNKINQLKNEA